jgi:imidazolonepropionase-like amidohydrolase
MESLLTMTRYGGEAMDLADDLGQIKKGFLADLLLVDGDPLEDLKVLMDPGKLSVIMKDGEFHKR